MNKPWESEPTPNFGERLDTITKCRWIIRKKDDNLYLEYRDEHNIHFTKDITQAMFFQTPEGVIEENEEWIKVSVSVTYHGRLETSLPIGSVPYLWRDDGERYTRNEDGTYTMDKNRERQPTSFYRYTYGGLMNTGCFSVYPPNKPKGD